MKEAEAEMELDTGWWKGDPDLSGPSAAEVLQPPGTSYRHFGHTCPSSESWRVVTQKILLFLDTNNIHLCGDEKIVYYLISNLNNFYLCRFVSQVQQLTYKEVLIKLRTPEVVLFHQ